jgi:hypothetical protein
MEQLAPYLGRLSPTFKSEGSPLLQVSVFCNIVHTHVIGFS